MDPALGARGPQAQGHELVADAAERRDVEKLRATPDGDGSLLDHLTLIYGSGMSDGNIHNHHDLPTLIVGGGSGTIKGGRHLRYPAKTPVTNLFLTLLDKVGVAIDTFGDSTGRLEPLSGV